MKIQRLTINSISMDLIYDKEKEEIKILDQSLTFKNATLQTILSEEKIIKQLTKVLNQSDIEYGILSLGAKLVDLYPLFLENDDPRFTKYCYVLYKGKKFLCNISDKPRGRITGLTDFYRKFKDEFKKDTLIKYNLYLDKFSNEYTKEKEEMTVLEITETYEKN